MPEFPSYIYFDYQCIDIYFHDLILYLLFVLSPLLFCFPSYLPYFWIEIVSFTFFLEWEFFCIKCSIFVEKCLFHTCSWYIGFLGIKILDWLIFFLRITNITPLLFAFHFTAETTCLFLFVLSFLYRCFYNFVVSVLLRCLDMFF